LRWGCAGAIIASALSIAALGAAPASASEPISSFTANVSEDQAGGHPEIAAAFELAEPGAPEAAQSARIDLPPGLVLLPSSVPTCTASTFAFDECPPATQVGLATVEADYGGDSDNLLGTAPIYALSPSKSDYGRLGFVVPGTEAHESAPISIRAATDYGVSATFEALDQSAPLAGLELTLWGVPASSGHDSARFPTGSSGHPAGCPGVVGVGCLGSPTASPSPEAPFTLAPTTCAEKHPKARLSVLTYDDPTEPSLAQSEMPATTGCDQLTFNPSLFAEPTSDEADSVSGLQLTVDDPLNMSPSVPTPSELREVGVALPYEMELNSESLDAHGICTDAEAAIGEEAPAECPDESLLGALSLKLASQTLTGFAYLGEPEPDGTLRLLLITDGEGVELKLVAYLELEPESEQFVLWLEELPQLPIGEYNLHLFGGREGPFVTPLYCEENEFQSLFVPWDEQLPEQTARAGFTLDSGPGGTPCLGPAEHVQVTLSPGSVPADGSSAVIATATVSDANGERVPWDELVFSSTDPGEKVGRVEALGDGRYRARIVASSAPGVATITAADLSVLPVISGSAQLTQLGHESPPQSAPTTGLTRMPPHASHQRRPKFRFTADVAGSSFECRLDHRAFKPCRSPFAAPKLAPGKHRFQVRAVGPTGLVGPVVAYPFRVLSAGRR
jgi:hypothetical protein